MFLTLTLTLTLHFVTFNGAVSFALLLSFVQYASTTLNTLVQCLFPLPFGDGRNARKQGMIRDFIHFLCSFYAVSS